MIEREPRRIAPDIGHGQPEAHVVPFPEKGLQTRVVQRIGRVPRDLLVGHVGEQPPGAIGNAGRDARPVQLGQNAQRKPGRIRHTDQRTNCCRGIARLLSSEVQQSRGLRRPVGRWRDRRTDRFHLLPRHGEAMSFRCQKAQAHLVRPASQCGALRQPV